MASFRINKVFLVESSFKLADGVVPGESGEFSLEVAMTRRQKSEKIVVSVDVTVKGYAEDKSDLLEMFVRMDGQFEMDGELPGLSEDYLANVNAPAIIYPFIREHVASVTAKAGIDSILIPPFNFVEHYQNMQERLKAEKSETEE